MHGSMLRRAAARRSARRDTRHRLASALWFYFSAQSRLLSMIAFERGDRAFDGDADHDDIGERPQFVEHATHLALAGLASLREVSASAWDLSRALQSFDAA